MGALTVGLEGQLLTDMASLADAGCVGISNAMQPVQNSLLMRRAMQYAATFNLTVFLYAQDPWLLGNGVVHEGIVSTRLGLPAVPEAAEIVGVARDLSLVETTGVKAHFCNLSSGRAVEMIAEAQDRDLPVTADVAAHYLHLCDRDIENFDTRFHVQPPLRTETDRDRLLDAVSAGVISAICSDHQPHELEAKLTPFGESAPGISGLETLLPLTLKLVH
jgi:dihydroorotase